MPATKTLRREFLQLADTFDPAKHNVAGYYISEKLDGTRCFWDGGITRGMKTKDVPWANTIDPKTGKTKAKFKPESSGLWSRYGNPIMATDEFLNALPCCPLDGELWAGRGNFQLCRSICAGDEPDPRFGQISYAVYSTPALAHVFQSGEIKNSNFTLNVDMPVVEKFVLARIDGGSFAREFVHPLGGSTFEDELVFLRGSLDTQNDHVFLHRQTKLPVEREAAAAAVEEFLAKVLDQGGEGVVIRNPNAIWTPKRHKGLLKYKPFEDAEAVVIGFVAGKEGKQGNVLGKIGALIVRTVGFENNVEFEIGSGLTFEQRNFTPRGPVAAALWAEANPGQTLPAEFKLSKHFVVGDTITFKYRELSDDGIPKEGRYWRKRDAE